MPASGRPANAAEVDDGGGRRARARPRRPLRRRADLERGRRARRVAGGAASRVRHRDVLPVEGSRRAGGLGAVRVTRRDRRCACPPGAARRSDASGRCHRRRRRRGAGDDGRAARPTTTRAPAGWPRRSPTRSPAASTRRRCTPTSCARGRDAFPPDLLDALASEGVLAGTVDPDTVALRHPQGRRRRRRSTTRWPSWVGSADHYIRMRGRLRRDPRPARWPSTPIPTIPRSPPAARSARWAAAGTEVWVLITTQGDKGTQDPDADLGRARRAPRRGDRQGGGAPRLRRHPSSRPSRRRARRRPRAARVDRAGDPRGATRRRAVPRPHRGVLRRRLLQPPRPPRHRLGHPRRRRARGREPALLPRAPRGGAGRAPRGRGVPVGHARAQLLGRHLRHARAQDRRAVLPRQPARPTTRGSGSATSCASAPRTPAPPPT